MAFTAKDVQALREKTGCGMMDCKKALVECDGNMDAAVDYLREKGLASQAKKATRIAAEGTVVAIYYDVKVVVEEVVETPTTATYTVEHHLQNAEGTYDLKESETLEGTIGEMTDAKAKTYKVYTNKEFAQVAIAADGTTVVAIEYDADPATVEEEALTMSDVVTVISEKKSTLDPL